MTDAAPAVRKTAASILYAICNSLGRSFGNCFRTILTLHKGLEDGNGPVCSGRHGLPCRIAIDHPRAKKGAPAHSTIGAASASSIQGEILGSTNCKPSRSVPIDSTSNGTASSADTHNRLVKSISSGLGVSSSVGRSGSSAMPQLGKSPVRPGGFTSASDRSRSYLTTR